MYMTICGKLAAATQLPKPFNGSSPTKAFSTGQKNLTSARISAGRPYIPTIIYHMKLNVLWTVRTASHIYTFKPSIDCCSLSVQLTTATVANFIFFIKLLVTYNKSFN